MLGMGIPSRMARAVQSLFAREGVERHGRKRDVLDAILADDLRIPLSNELTGLPSGEGAIAHAAEAAARECYAICHRVQTADAILIAVGMVCRRRGIEVPRGESLAEVIARAVDKGWWRRHLRNEWKRRFEHTAIQLGLTSVRADPYVSRETAIMQECRNRENQKLLESCTATNENGDKYSVAELAALGVGNKTIRRGELMLRIRGIEEVADDLAHVGMFWTITCPSKFHSVGGTNDKYRGATPRDAQAYLVKVWARIRAALHRDGIRPYGFRIAEPHSDGCPHWHMLLFVDPARAERMNEIIRAYALEEDGAEDGAQANRVKLVAIEAGKGTAAGYIAKYVSKNIDGAGVGDHKTFENGRTYVVGTDIFGELEITASQRVTYWSQVWGIRQFQQIGGAPVGVWRELRRVTAETVQGAPEALRAAHQACQKIASDDPAVAKQASFADYIRAQGGPECGRHAAIKVANKEVSIVGRYSTHSAAKPVGVYLVAQPNAVYESVRYTWTISGPGESAGAAFDLPRTGVNNCTGRADAPHWARPPAPGEAPKNEIFRSGFSTGRKFDRQGAPAAPGADIGADVAKYQRHRARPAGAPSGHLLYLQQKYKD